MGAALRVTNHKCQTNKQTNKQTTQSQKTTKQQNNKKKQKNIIVSNKSIFMALNYSHCTYHSYKHLFKH